jgi:chromosome partitioning protein
MIIAMCGQKGGSGKTTAAVAVAAELLARNCKVLLVDADPQATARTWAALAVENGNPAPTVVAMDATMHKPGQLGALVDRFDHVIIDCPPRHGDVQRSALAVADLAVLPCGPSAFDAWALGESIELVDAARQRFPKLRAVALITRKISRTTVGESARQVLKEAGLSVLAAELHQRVAYQEAPAAGLGVTQYAPHDPASDEVRALVDEITGGRRNGKAHARRPQTTTAA